MTASPFVAPFAFLEASREQRMASSLTASTRAGESRRLAGLAIALTLGCLQATTGSAQTSSGRTCSLPFDFPAEAVEARILMLSNIGGTHEPSRLTAELACTFAGSGAPVAVAIQMSRDEQPALDAYLASDGGETARLALISRPYWTEHASASVATLALIERVRELRRSGDAVSLLAIDASASDLSSPPTLMRQIKADAADAQLSGATSLATLDIARTEIMARLLIDAIARDRERRFVILLGGLHVERLRSVPFPGPDSTESLGTPRLAALTSPGAGVTSLSTAFLGGSWWRCVNDRGDCGPRKFPRSIVKGQAAFVAIETGSRGAPGVYVWDDSAGFDGLIVFERLTAAEPANPQATSQASANRL
jgi:hypothetical protein